MYPWSMFSDESYGWFFHIFQIYYFGFCGQHFADTKICAGDRRDSSLEPTLVTTAQVSQDRAKLSRVSLDIRQLFLLDTIYFLN